MYKDIIKKKPWGDHKSIKPPKMIRCEGCGRLIEEEKAYCLIAGPKKHFYCSKEEYEGGDEYRAKRDKFEDGIKQAVKKIVCYDQKDEDYSFSDGLYNTLITEWAKSASFEKIYYYLTYEEERLRGILVSKDIDRITSRLKYLNAVLINNIADYNTKRPGMRPIDQSNVYQDMGVDSYKPNFKPRKNLRRSMEDLEDEYGN